MKQMTHKGHCITLHTPDEHKSSSNKLPSLRRKKDSASFQDCGLLEIWALGIVIVIGGDFFSWNAGIQFGFGNMLVSTILNGMGYIALLMCTSEMFSGLPFSGGAYGIIRCTFGFFPGFLIGCCEALEYIAYVSLSVLSLMSLVEVMFPLNAALFHGLLATFYACTSLVLVLEGRIFWKFVTFLGIISFITVVIFSLGTLKWTSVQQIATSRIPLFSEGLFGFVNCFPLASWFFIGIEGLCFASESTQLPKKTIPQASIVCVITLFVSSLFVLCVASAAPKGQNELQDESFPLNTGFSLIFNCSYRAASALSIPATFATAFGFMFSYGRLICGLAQSGLLPQILSLQSSRGSPFIAIIAGSLSSYGICLLVVFIPTTGCYVYRVCFLSAYITYCCQCISYIYVKTRFGSIKCSFKSPFGISGAVFSFVIFLLGAVSISFFQTGGSLPLPCLLLVWCFLSAYYFMIAKNQQKFSREEQKSVLVAHTIRYNCSKSRKRRRNKKRKHITFRSGVLIVGMSRYSSRGSMQSVLSGREPSGRESKWKGSVNVHRGSKCIHVRGVHEEAKD